MKTRIRRAEIGDLDLLLQWRAAVLREVFCLSDERRIEELTEQNARYYRTALPAGGHIACFACEGGEIVGCGGVCLYDEMPSPDNPRGKCAYLMNIYVLPAFRGRKTGKSIASWLIARAREAGADKIYLESSESGLPLYRALGFTAMEGMMKLPFD